MNNKEIAGTIVNSYVGVTGITALVSGFCAARGNPIQPELLESAMIFGPTAVSSAYGAIAGLQRKGAVKGALFLGVPTALLTGVCYGAGYIAGKI